MEAISVLGQAIRHLNHRGYIYIWANLAAIVCSLPLVTAPAAWAGLVRLSTESYLSPTADLHDFWQGFRENLRRSLILSLLNLVIIGINGSNLVTYRDQSGIFAG
ncbi:MAG TPA: hypothetical protein VHL11_19795, partial [Phototrophicaceae bacterium]|nr:hypothetical protein [Phototrophicaceae bacterium]